MRQRVLQWLTADRAEFLFRLLFSLIFLGVGLEHIFADDLLQRLMPSWVPAKRVVSVLSGMVLVSGGTLVLLGYQLRKAALLLGSFLVVVTLTVHLPALWQFPAFLPKESQWMWAILQRSNFAKNLCLLGVCCYLLYHQPGKYSLLAWRQRQSEKGNNHRDVQRADY